VASEQKSTMIPRTPRPDPHPSDGIATSTEYGASESRYLGRGATEALAATAPHDRLRSQLAAGRAARCSVILRGRPERR
jgi:hypothetical protein